MQFDSEKADKITRGACNDDKVIFENPEFYFREAEGVRKWASHSGAQWRNYRARPRPRKTQRGGALCPGPKLPVRSTYRELTQIRGINWRHPMKRTAATLYLITVSLLLVARRKNTAGSQANFMQILRERLSLRSKPE